MNNIDSICKIYVITHKNCSFLKSDVIVPIATNEEIANELGIITSTDEDNGLELNKIMAEFSTFYWVWKNKLHSKYIGFFHYYRYLLLNCNYDIYSEKNNIAYNCGITSSYVENVFEEYDLILPKAQEFNITVYDQYCLCHEKPYIDLLLNIINEKYPKYSKSFNKAFNAKKGYFCNLFIMKFDDFNNYMSLIMGIFNEMHKYLLYSKQIKPFAYLGERIFCGYVEFLKNDKNYKVKEVPVLFGVDNDTWVIKPTTGM